MAYTYLLLRHASIYLYVVWSVKLNSKRNSIFTKQSPTVECYEFIWQPLIGVEVYRFRSYSTTYTCRCTKSIRKKPKRMPFISTFLLQNSSANWYGILWRHNLPMDSSPLNKIRNASWKCAYPLNENASLKYYFN